MLFTVVITEPLQSKCTEKAQNIAQIEKGVQLLTSPCLANESVL